MIRIALVSIAASLAVVGTARADTKDDLAKMEGDWVPVTADLGGKPFPVDLRNSMKLVLKGDTYTVTVGEAVDRGTVKIDSSKSPKTMDITGTEGPNKGKTIAAIYEVSADSLKVCYNLGGTDHPTEFKSPEGSKLFLVEYKRPKK